MKHTIVVLFLFLLACVPARQEPKPDIPATPNAEFLWLDETTGNVYTNAQLIEIVNRSKTSELKELLDDAAKAMDETPDEKTREELLGRIDDYLDKLKQGDKK